MRVSALWGEERRGTQQACTHRPRGVLGSTSKVAVKVKSSTTPKRLSALCRTSTKSSSVNSSDPTALQITCKGVRSLWNTRRMKVSWKATSAAADRS